MHETNKTDLIKKLVFLSKNRGWRENDLLLGKFASNKLDQFSISSLIVYNQFINETDPDIFNWLTEKFKLPTKYQIDIIYQLINYNKKYNED